MRRWGGSFCYVLLTKQQRAFGSKLTEMDAMTLRASIDKRIYRISHCRDIFLSDYIAWGVFRLQNLTPRGTFVQVGHKDLSNDPPWAKICIPLYPSKSKQVYHLKGSLCPNLGYPLQTPVEAKFLLPWGKVRRILVCLFLLQQQLCMIDRRQNIPEGYVDYHLSRRFEGTTGKRTLRSYYITPSCLL